MYHKIWQSRNFLTCSSFIFLAKRKLNAEGEYDPSSPTSENNDEAPTKKVALSSDTEAGDKQEIKPASPKKKTLPELEKYWKAVNEDPSDFTGWTYLLQYVDQEVNKRLFKSNYLKVLLKIQSMLIILFFIYNLYNMKYNLFSSYIKS